MPFPTPHIITNCIDKCSVVPCHYEEYTFLVYLSNKNSWSGYSGRKNFKQKKKKQASTLFYFEDVGWLNYTNSLENLILFTFS